MQMGRVGLAISGFVLAVALGCSSGSANDGPLTRSKNTAEPPATPGDDTAKAFQVPPPSNEVGHSTEGAAAADEFAFFRVANFSELPAIDFCFRAHDATGAAPFEGPYFASRTIATGLFAPLVTFYIARGPAQYDLRFVAPASSDCSTAVAPDVLTLPALAPHAFWTFAVTGSPAASDFAVSPFEDDFASDPSRVHARAVNLVVGSTSIDLGFGANDSFVPLFVDVRYRGVAASGDVDARGYRAVPESTNGLATARAAASSTDVAAGHGLNLSLSEVSSFFVIGTLGAARIVFCNDRGAVASPFAACSAMR
jgi:hypothetical protein